MKPLITRDNSLSPRSAISMCSAAFRPTTMLTHSPCLAPVRFLPQYRAGGPRPLPLPAATDSLGARLRLWRCPHLIGKPSFFLLEPCCRFCCAEPCFGSRRRHLRLLRPKLFSRTARSSSGSRNGSSAFFFQLFLSQCGDRF